VALYPRRATTFLSLGYAFPGFLLLFISRGIFGVPPKGGQKELHEFFAIVLCMAVLAFITAQILLYISHKQLSANVDKNPNEGEEEEKPSKRIKPNNFLILKQIWKSSVGIGLLMISRITVFTILFRVPSTFTEPDDKKRIFPDISLYQSLCRFIWAITDWSVTENANEYCLTCPSGGNFNSFSQCYPGVTLYLFWGNPNQ
jgi:quinol-cytochrome oxidoreductase complex cytochrome b subunit